MFLDVACLLSNESASVGFPSRQAAGGIWLIVELGFAVEILYAPPYKVFELFF